MVILRGKRNPRINQRKEKENKTSPAEEHKRKRKEKSPP